MLTPISQFRLIVQLGLAVAMAPSLLAACSKQEIPTKVFQDVTEQSGLGDYKGMTFGTAWGDFAGDGLPGVYLPNHLNPQGAMLFRNLGNGRFEEVTQQWFSPKDLGGDKHGAAWADVDNNGRLDLVQLTGAEGGVGSESKRLFMNRGTKFEEAADAMGVSNPYSRARIPLWLDLNRDGWLDLFEGAETRFDERMPPFIFLRQGDRLVESADSVKFASRGVPFCILTELNQDAYPELVCRVLAKGRTAQVLDTATLPARELDLLPISAFEDIAAGDFDNDGWIDLVLARKNPSGKVAFGQPGSNEIITDFWLNKPDFGKPAGFSFRSAGILNFHVASTHPADALTAEKIHIGDQGWHPEGLRFVLSPETTGVAGTASYSPSAPTGLYIGLTPPDQWQVQVSSTPDPASGDPLNYQQIAVEVRSSEPIAKLEAIGEPAKAEEAPQRLFMNRSGKLVEESDRRGVNAKAISGVNVVAGDFDNDMNLDLFILGSADVGQRENLLLLNRGGGDFEIVAAAGGAAGPGTGVGDSVTTADVDGDGFLDLLVATGGSMGPGYGLPSDSGSYHLYRNVGNGNRWLEIDLEGAPSNRDGIGAIVQVTASGVTQTRVQDGGVHHRGQNHSRLHFGLAKNPRADLIRVQWPSGKVQELREVAANQILRIREAP